MPAATSAPLWFSLVIALAMNLSNLFEPLTVDDACHALYAAQVAKEPLRPFEFELDWHQKPVVAWDVMVAPVNSYYLAPAMAWFGDSPVAWKAWFLPVQWLFCHSLLRLLVLFVGRHARALLVAIALGPSVLPGVNLMLEVPMLAPALTSLVVLLRAIDRRHLGIAAFAGLLLGLALQTKYSAMGFLAPWGLFAAVRGGWRELACGVAVAAAVAGCIEALVGLSHGGGSYFLRQLELTQLRDWGHLLRGMFLQVGGLGMPVALLAAFALGLAPWLRWGALCVYGLGYASIVSAPRFGAVVGGRSVDSIAHGGMALLTWGLLGLLFARIGAIAWSRWRADRLGMTTRTAGLLLVWFAAEMAASLLVSPFPAARRSMLVVLVFAIATAWLAVRRRGGGRALRTFAIASLGLGGLYQGIDCLDSNAVVAGARGTIEYTRGIDPAARVYFTGGWGFEYYAPRYGMAPFCRGRTQVQRGDFVAVGSVDGDEEPWFDWRAPGWLQKVDPQPHEIAIGDGVPVSLLMNYYSGRRSLDAQVGPRFVVRVYRAREPFGAQDLAPVVNPWRDH